MNCFRHTEHPAVTICEKCKLGMCVDCSQSGITLDDKPVCRNCAKPVLEDKLKQLAAFRGKTLSKLIVAIVLYVLGIIGFVVMTTTLPSSGHFQSQQLPSFMLLFLFWYGCFGAAGCLSSGGFIQRLFAPGAAHIGGGVTLLFLLFFYFGFGVIIAPFNMLRLRNDLKNTENIIANDRALLTQIAN